MTSSRFVVRLMLCVVAIYIAGSVSACVSQSEYKDAVNSLESSRADLEAREKQLEAIKQQVAMLKQDVSDVDAQLATCERSYRGAIRESEEVRRRLAETQQDNIVIAESCLAQSSQSKEMRAKLKETLEEARAEQQELLEEVNRLRQEANQRQQIHRELVDRFQDMIDAGQLDVSIIDGRIVINLPQDILFGSGSAQVSPEGRRALSNVGDVLSDFRNRLFQVEGHTDNVPISTARFPSNWELSTARALAVVHILIGRNVPADNLSAAGYGSHRPVVPNTSPANRALNRRIEIVMLPKLQGLDSEDSTQDSSQNSNDE